MSEFAYKYLCLTPSLAFNVLKEKARSIVFTSGTLQPFNGYSTKSSVNVDFSITYTCGHVIDSKKQLSIQIVPKLKFANIPAQYDYKNRNNETLKHHTGVLLGNFSRIVPQGMVVFFPSYWTMDAYIKKWKTNGGGAIWKILESQKYLAIESRDKKQFEYSWRMFSKACNTKNFKIGGNNPSNGGIFFAVAGAKLSEGIDFTDGMARLVVMVGIPNKSTKAAKVN